MNEVRSREMVTKASAAITQAASTLPARMSTARTVGTGSSRTLQISATGGVEQISTQNTMLQFRRSLTSCVSVRSTFSIIVGSSSTLKARMYQAAAALTTTMTVSSGRTIQRNANGTISAKCSAASAVKQLTRNSRL